MRSTYGDIIRVTYYAVKKKAGTPWDHRTGLFSVDLHDFVVLSVAVLQA